MMNQRYYVFLFLLSLGLALGATGQTLLSPEQFTDYYQGKMKEMYPDQVFTITAELEIAMSSGDDKTAIYLDNVYTEYKNSPDQLDPLIDSYGQALAGYLAPKEEPTVEKIVPVIKDAEYINQVQALYTERDADNQSPLVILELNNVLRALFVFDSPYSMQFVTEENIKALGIADEELMNIALKNLLNVVPNLSADGNPARVSYLIADGNYEASFILLEDLWNKDNFPVQGEIIIYLPSRDAVLITGSEDTESQAAIAKIIAENEWPHFISEQAFVRRDNRWQVFRP